MVRDGRGADEVLKRPLSGVGLLLSESVFGWEVDEREWVLWKERREAEVVGRGRGGVSCVEVVGELPERDVVDVAAEILLLPPVSTSGLLRGASRGLGAADGFSLAARLCAYELKASGVENGGYRWLRRKDS